MNLKVGDWVRLTEKGESGGWTVNKSLLKKGKAKILSIREDSDSIFTGVICILDGINNNKECFFTLDELKKVEEEKKEMENNLHKDLEKIDKKHSTLAQENKLEVTTSYKDPKWCLVSNDNKQWDKAILITDNSNFNLIHPYLVIYNDKEIDKFLKNEKCCNSIWRYAKPLLKKEYRAYSEPKLEWIMKETKVKEKITGNEYKILALLKEGVYVEDLCSIRLKDLLKNFTWLDGSVCGDEVLDKLHLMI